VTFAEMPETRAAGLRIPFFGTHAERPALPERMQFQVVIQLAPTEPMAPDELEDAATRAVAVLVENAAGVALGAVGGVDFKLNAVEIEFTVEALSPAVFYAKFGEVLRILQEGGFEFEASTQSLLRGELQPA
jgi:hypothetical protein